MLKNGVTNRSLFEYMFTFFLCFILLKPTPTKLLGNVLAMRLFDMIAIMIIILIISFAFKYPNVFLIKKEVFRVVPMILLILLAFISLVSQYIASVILVIPTVSNDLFELYRYFYYFLVFFLGYISGTIFETKRFERIFLSIGGLVIFIAILQYYNPMNVQNLISLVYTDEKLRSVHTSNPRVFGSMYNANWFGVFTAIWTSYLFHLFSNSRFKSSVLWFLFLLYGFFGVYISGSRTAFILTIIGIIVSIIFSLYKNFNVKKVVILLTFISGLNVLLSIASENSKRFNEFYLAIKDGNLLEVSSFEGRVSTMSDSMDYALINPLTGIGFGNFYSLLPHNSYLLIFIQFGIVGTAVFLTFFMYNIIHNSIKFVKCNKESESIVMLGLLTGIIFIVAMLTGEYINSIQLISFYMLLIGYVFGLKEFKEVKS